MNKLLKLGSSLMSYAWSWMGRSQWQQL